MYEVIPASIYRDVYEDVDDFSADLQFAFATIVKDGQKGGKKLRQLHQFVRCREIFCNVLIFSHFKSRLQRPVVFEGDKKQIDSDALRILVNTKAPKRKTDNLLRLVNYIEAKYRIKKSKILSLKKHGLFLITASRRWIQNPWMLSIYTLLLRLSLNIPKSVTKFNELLTNPQKFSVISNLYGEDSTYLFDLRQENKRLNSIEIVVKHSQKIFRNWDSFKEAKNLKVNYCETSEQGGIVSLFENVNELIEENEERQEWSDLYGFVPDLYKSRREQKVENIGMKPARKLLKVLKSYER